MPKLNIDGKEIEVPKGTRVIEAAKKLGIDVPYYCYHPGLSIAGNCRMCLVEIEKMPKLQISCHMECQDGMVVKTNTEKVLKTRQHVLEFLLVNHPLDCPVCDQAGECWLQDYYMKHGLYDSRVSENKIKKPKAVSIGPTVMLDAERCILCSRCVRFCDEVSKTSELGIVNRGDHSEITVFPDKELENKYSGNVVDICPVGALTDKDFRFKMRVWYLKSVDSICNGCSRGCNIQMQYSTQRTHHAKGDRVMRLKPRFNENINKWWMCDEGRYSYKFHDHGRILEPSKRQDKQPYQQSWEALIPEIVRQIENAKGKIGIILSPQMTNEEIYLSLKLFRDDLKISDIYLVKAKVDGYQDEFLIRADKNPNSKGAEFLGLTDEADTLNEFTKRCEQGLVDGLIIFGQDLLSLKRVNESIFQKVKWSLFIGSNQNLTTQFCDYVLPSATYAEKEGTFTNFEGRIQRFERALFPLGESKPEFEILATLAKAMGIHLHYDEAEEIFNEMALKVAPFQGLSYEKLGVGSSDIRTMAMPTIPALEQQDNIL